MGNVWRNGKIVGATEPSSGYRSESFPDDEPFGFGVSTSGCKGVGQNLLLARELDRVHPSNTSLVMGEDKRVYEWRHGLIECLAPAKVVGNEPKVYVDDVDWSKFTPTGELAWLFHHFFSHFKDREVVMLVGRRRDGQGHLYHVPEQVGTCGGVKWNADDEEMDWFQDQAYWIGTIHSHPSNCARPSQTDIDDWADPEKSGLHVIFGRNGSFTVNGAIAERTFTLFKSDLCGVVSTTVTYSTSKGRSLSELLKKPKPVVVKRSVSRGVVTWARPTKGQRVYPSLQHDEVDDDFVEEALDVLGVLPLDQDDGPPTVCLVWYNECTYAMTARQYGELVEWCRGVCPVPRSKKMRLFNTRRSGG